MLCAAGSAIAAVIVAFWPITILVAIAVRKLANPASFGASTVAGSPRVLTIIIAGCDVAGGVTNAVPLLIGIATLRAGGAFAVVIVASCVIASGVTHLVPKQ